mgnify:CR=1 FL=1
MFTSLLLQASGAAGSATGGMADFVTDLSNTIGIDLFDEDIDNVVFQTNEFLCNSDFIGSQGPFWWILQMSMALGALFSIIVAGGLAYKMMVKNEPIDVFKIMKVLGIALVMCFWYPPSMSGIGGNSNASILDALAYIPNCIGSYTHDLYEAEAEQVSSKYNELAPLLKKRDEKVDSIAPEGRLRQKSSNPHRRRMLPIKYKVPRVRLRHLLLHKDLPTKQLFQESLLDWIRLSCSCRL